MNKELTVYEPVLTGWQPIETAPKNVSVLVYIPNAEHYGEGIYRAILVDMRPDLRDPHWTSTALHAGRDIGSEYQPTHWMPLPDPPAQPRRRARPIHNRGGKGDGRLATN